jgi:membrane protein
MSVPKRKYAADAPGSSAERPSAIRTLGWKDVLIGVRGKITCHNLSMIAAGVAFYAFLAIFPGIAAFVSIYGLIVDRGTLQEHMRTIQVVLPPDAARLVTDEMQRIASQPHTLGWASIIGIILALWSASTGMKALFQALNVAYEQEERRGFIRLNAAALLMTLGAVVFVLLCLGLIVGVPALLATVPFGSFFAASLEYMRWPVLAFAGMITLAALYRYGPSREKRQWKWLTWGAAAATVLWLAGSALFSFYVTNFAGYNKTYGSLGVVVALMMWLLLSVWSVLIGAEINAEMEHPTDSANVP